MSSKNPFPKAGKPCPSCTPKRKKRDLPPFLLVALPNRTQNRKYEIAICPYCDGDRLLDHQDNEVVSAP